MAYINVGARLEGQRIRTKKALKAALLEGDVNSPMVQFDTTSPLGPGGLTTLTVEDLLSTEHRNSKFQVTGPDPYTDRRWYATVEVVNHEVRVS